MSKVRIVLMAPGRGHIYVDDQEIKCVTDFQLRAGVGNPSELILRLHLAEVEIDGEHVDVTALDNAVNSADSSADPKTHE